MTTNPNDPFATPAQQDAPVEPAGSNLAAAPEVGIDAAQTAPGSRQRRSEQEKAQAALDVATRRVESIQARKQKAEADVERLKAELQGAESQRDYLAKHPALQTDQPLPGV